MWLGARYASQQQRLIVQLRQSTHDRESRIVSHSHIEIELLLEITRQSFQRSATASQYQPAIENVARHLRRQIAEQRPHFFSNFLNYRHRDRVNLARRQIDSARTTRLHVATANVDLLLRIFRLDRRTELEF